MVRSRHNCSRWRACGWWNGRSTDQPPRKAPDLSQAVQSSLFQERSSNVIAMPPRVEIKPRIRADAPARPPRRSPRPRRAKPVPEGQGTLDFLPPAVAKPRQLGTTVEAVIYCEAPVATTLHRAVACALDWSMVLLGYALFLLGFSLLGGQFELTKSNLTIFGAMFLMVGFTYGLLFAWAGTGNAGNASGRNCASPHSTVSRPIASSALVRFCSSCLSRCTQLGLLWSLADEESLAWHDHLAHVPTPRDSQTLVFRDE